METILPKLAEHGVVALFLVAVIYYFIKKEKELKEEMKQKSIAHAQQMKEKDDKIEDLNVKIHEMGIEAVTSVKEWTNTLKELLK